MGRLESFKERLVREFRSPVAPPTIAQQLHQAYDTRRAVALESIFPVGAALVTAALTKDVVLGGLVGLAVLSLEELAPMEDPLFS